MLLGQLRAWLAEYKKEYWKHIRFRGMHQRAKGIEFFLEEFKNRPDSYPLGMPDLFRLVKLVAGMDPDLPLIKKTRDALSTLTDFFEIIKRLDEQSCIDVGIFEELYRNSDLVMRFNKTQPLFQGLIKAIADDSEKIDFIQLLISIEKRNGLGETRANACLLLFTRFQQQHMLTPGLMALIKKEPDHLPMLCPLIEAFHSIKVKLKEQHIACFLDNPDSAVLKFVQTMNKSGISLTPEILNLMFPVTHHGSMVMNLCKDLIDFQAHLLDENQIIFLFKNDSNILVNCLELLLKQKIVNREIIDNVLEVKEIPALYDILRVLEKISVLSAVTLMLVLNSERSLKSLVLDMWVLSEKKVLDAKTLSWLVSIGLPETQKIKLFELFSSASKIDVPTLWKQIIACPVKHVYSLLVLAALLKDTTLFTKEIIDELLGIKNSYWPEMLVIASALKASHKLDRNSFMLLVNRMSIKIPMPAEASVVFKEAHHEGKFWKKFYVNESDKSIFFCDKDEEKFKSGRGFVFEGFADLDANRALYLVKNIKKEETGTWPFTGIEDLQFKEARREVKYNRFFGRDANFFKHKDEFYLVSDWIPGQSLDTTAPAVLTAIPLEKRFAILLPLITGLVNLHASFRVHGDIKPGNCVFNPEKNSLSWIDFGSTRKIKYKNYGLAATHKCLPSDYQDYGFATDMYSLGIVVASLFPDLYAINIQKRIEVCPLLSTMTPEQEAVKRLVDCLMNKDEHLRCTSERASAYIHKVLATFTNLTASRLDMICQTTINAPEATQEDIIYGRTLAASAP